MSLSNLTQLIDLTVSKVWNLNNKNFKKIIIWLIVILLILVGTLGLYSKKLNTFANIIPNYELGSDLMKNYYEILNIKQNSSNDEIKSAFR